MSLGVADTPPLSKFLLLVMKQLAKKAPNLSLLWTREICAPSGETGLGCPECGFLPSFIPETPRECPLLARTVQAGRLQRRETQSPGREETPL